MARVKVYNPEGTGWLGTKYEINGKEVPNVDRVDFRVGVNEIPHFEFHMYGEPDIEMDADVSFISELDTIGSAERTLQRALRENNEYRSACIMVLKGILDRICGDNIVNEVMAGAIIEQVKKLESH